MAEVFLKKIINRDFEKLTVEEFQTLIEYYEVFNLKKKDKKILEKAIANIGLASEKDKAVAMLKEALPNAHTILASLDLNSIEVNGVGINFRKSFLENLKRMDNLQLCIFIDKVLMLADSEGLKFFKRSDYSLHAINEVVSKSFGLNLTFEIFKAGEYKTFMAIDYNRINKELMIDTIDKQTKRYLHILNIISKIVLETKDKALFGTKINKTIREQTQDYVRIIHREHERVVETGIAKQETWTYVLNGPIDYAVEDEPEFGDSLDNKETNDE